MKRITDALKSTAITMGISLALGAVIFSIIRFLNPEMAMAVLLTLIAVFVFAIHYRK